MDSRGSSLLFRDVTSALRDWNPAVWIYIRAVDETSWCASAGTWVSDRAHAMRFRSNIEAMVFCQAVGVGGLLVGYDAADSELYTLSINAMLEVLCDGTQTH